MCSRTFAVEGADNWSDILYSVVSSCCRGTPAGTACSTKLSMPLTSLTPPASTQTRGGLCTSP